MAPTRPRKATRTSPSSFIPKPPSARELVLQRRKMLVAQGKRIDGAVFAWRDCMRELKETENIKHETGGWENKINMCKSYAQTELKTASHVIFSEVNTAECARMPPRSSPELILK